MNPRFPTYVLKQKLIFVGSTKMAPLRRIRLIFHSRKLNEPFDQYFMFPENNENFVFIDVQHSYNSPTRERNTRSLHSYINPAVSETVRPYLVYQSTMPNLNVEMIFCNTHASESSCILTINQKLGIKL